MAAIDLRQPVWLLHRGFLRHGIGFGLVLAGILTVLLLLIMDVATWLRVRQVDDALAARLVESHVAGNRMVEAVPAHTVTLPEAMHRFELTRRILSGLEEAGFEPEQIRFKFEEMDDAGLLRQTAVFNLKAGWREIARALVSLQATDRSLYIAKLRLERESPEDPLVQAEIQIAVALTRSAVDEREAP